jgi:methylmalonyl-CoA mutase
MGTMPETLFQEFPPTSTAEWEAAITKDLKGGDYDKKLIWRTVEGMGVRPYYRADDTASLDWAKVAPGEFPYLRGTHVGSNWRIRENIDAAETVEANRAARAAVTAGAEEIAFGRIITANISDIALLLAELDGIPVHLATVDERLANRVVQHLKKAPRSAAISMGLNPLKELDLAAQLAEAAPAGLIPFSIDGGQFEESGATAVEEIGFTLAAGVDYLAAMDKRGVDVARAARLVEFSFSIGRNYFFAIAKLRAFRMLWARVVECFGAPVESGKARISARTSRWNKTVYDPHVNVLRATTEAMSAVLGGADSVTVAAFDECYAQPDEASRRLARNTQIILKKEAMLARVTDPGGGSYALETITDYLAREAWKRMQEIEVGGGFRKVAGWMKKALDQSMVVRDKNVALRRRVLVGVNQYANPAEKALPRTDLAKATATQRGSHAYEELRFRTEQNGDAPRVLIAEIGDAKMRAARSSFATNFFACAGFGLIPSRFDKVDEIVSAEADLIVLCSSDADYPKLVSELMPKLGAAGRTTPVIVAGNPENAEELKKAGVADFIHVRSNPLEVLAAWQQRLGVKEA